MYHLIKPFLFQLKPEPAHYLTVKLLRFTLGMPLIGTWFRNFYTIKNKNLERNVFGLTFKNPVGLAAGFDKDGKYYHDISSLGFGFIEIGTVTSRPQDGNPQPRLFRLKKDKGLINRMGFNNEGVEAMVKRLKATDIPEGLIIGGNIGKNKTTPNEKAIEDYTYCFDLLFPYVDYFVVNVSSPNTPNLRALQDKEPLTKLLNHLQAINFKQQSPKPLLLKIAPDLTDTQLDDIIDITKTTKIDGLIATNTTISRAGLTLPSEKISAIGNGGLSGLPLKDKATEVIAYLRKQLPNVAIIGVGGISSPQDAIEKLEAGADLIQVYSGMVYYGPSLIKDINKAILKNQK